MTTANAGERERAIRERLAAATPGRWDWNHRYELHNTKAAIIEVEQIATGAHVLKVAQPDAALIANAPPDIAWLLDRVDTLTRERDAARTALEAERVNVAKITIKYNEAHDALDDLYARRKSGETNLTVYGRIQWLRENVPQAWTALVDAAAALADDGEA